MTSFRKNNIKKVITTLQESMPKLKKLGVDNEIVEAVEFARIELKNYLHFDTEVNLKTKEFAERIFENLQICETHIDDIDALRVFYLTKINAISGVSISSATRGNICTRRGRNDSKIDKH